MNNKVGLKDLELEVKISYYYELIDCLKANPLL